MLLDFWLQRMNVEEQGQAQRSSLLHATWDLHDGHKVFVRNLQTGAQKLTSADLGAPGVCVGRASTDLTCWKGGAGACEIDKASQQGAGSMLEAGHLCSNLGRPYQEWKIPEGE